VNKNYFTSKSTETNTPSKINGNVQKGELSLKGEVKVFTGSRSASGDTEGGFSSARFLYPNSITSDGKSVYVVEISNSVVRVVE
jgi:hypothetical protein